MKRFSLANVIIITGLILFSFSSYGDNKIKYINADVLNLRSEANINSRKIGELYLGDKIVVLERTQEQIKVNDKKNYWYKIKKGKIIGWVFGEYLVDENIKFLGKFRYYDSVDKEQHFLEIRYDKSKKKYYGIYIGSELMEGEGVYYYKNDLYKLNINEDGIISFTILSRDLYLKPIDFTTFVSKIEPIGRSGKHLIYTGKIINERIELNCICKAGNKVQKGINDFCWKSNLEFKRLNTSE